MPYSMDIFLMILPLVEPHRLKDFLYRVTGEPNDTYLDDKLVDLWNSIPESPSKNYVCNYVYFHILSPAVIQCEGSSAEKCVEKLDMYYQYLDSRQYREELNAYLAQLNAFRRSLKS